jgi:carbonic anhydrase
MKQQLSILILFLLLNLITFSCSSELSENMIPPKRGKSTTTEKAGTLSANVLKIPANSFTGYYFLQKLYSGDNPGKIIDSSEQSTKLRFIILGDMSLGYSKDDKTASIEDSLQLAELFQDGVDSVENAKCCSRVVYRTFPGCKDGDCPKSGTNVPVELAANKCLEVLNSKTGITWRICHDNLQILSKLSMKLNFSILKLKAGKTPNKLVEQFLLNSSGLLDTPTEKSLKDYWEKQESWSGFCQRKDILQSPINIETGNVIKVEKNIPGVNSSKPGSLKINYDFKEAKTVIKKIGSEIKVFFQDYAGMLVFSTGSNELNYQIESISFRFPGEHTIDGKRPMGDMLVNFTEMVPDTKLWLTTGLTVSIPLNAVSDESSPALESLDMDMWKFELKDKSEYIPKQMFKKEEMKFAIGDIFKKVMDLNPEFYNYVGTETVPPCRRILSLFIFSKCNLDDLKQSFKRV